MAAVPSQSAGRDRVYDVFYPSSEALDTLDQLETRALAVCNSHLHSTDMELHSTPIRYDMQARVQQSTALDTSAIVALHESCQQMGREHTTILENMERFYRTAAHLRSKFSTLSGLEGDSPVLIDIDTPRGIASTLEERRIQLFRGGQEKLYLEGIFNEVLPAQDTSFDIEELALLEGMWENQGIPHRLEMRALAALHQHRAPQINQQSFQAFFLTKSRRLLIFAEQYRSHWHETRMRVARHQIELTQRRRARARTLGRLTRLFNPRGQTQVQPNAS